MRNFDSYLIHVIDWYVGAALFIKLIIYILFYRVNFIKILFFLCLMRFKTLSKVFNFYPVIFTTVINFKYCFEWRKKLDIMIWRNFWNWEQNQALDQVNIYLRQNSSALTKHAKLKDNQQRRICSMAQFLIMNQPMQYLLIRQNEKRRFCKV